MALCLQQHGRSNAEIDLCFALSWLPNRIPGGTLNMKVSDSPRRVLRTSAAAQYLGMSEWKLRRLVADRVLPIVQYGEGAPWQFDVNDLDGLIGCSKRQFGE